MNDLIQHFIKLYEQLEFDGRSNARKSFSHMRSFGNSGRFYGIEFDYIQKEYERTSNAFFWGKGGDMLSAYGAFGLPSITGNIKSNPTLAWLGDRACDIKDSDTTKHIILGEFTATPNHLIFGYIFDKKSYLDLVSSQEKYFESNEYKKENEKICKKLESSIISFVILFRMVVRFRGKLTSSFGNFKRLINEYGASYSKYSYESGITVDRATTYAQIVMGIIGTPIFNEDGEFNNELCKEIEELLTKVEDLEKEYNI